MIIMKLSKILILVVVTHILFGCLAAQTNKSKKPAKTNPAAVSINKEAQNGAVKIIAEGAYGSIETPFVFVARSTETYAQLQSLVNNLPPVSEIDFSRTAIVAAFAGTKNTGGYSVTIRRANGKIIVNVVEPAKDLLTTDALTTPFTVASVPSREGSPLPLEISANWIKAARTYKVVSGKLVSSGRLKKMNVAGTIGVLSFGEYVTLVFNLSGKGADKKRNLTEIASGLMKNGALDLARIEVGSFFQNSKPPLKVSGTLTDDKLIAEFNRLPTNAAGGFRISGQIEAVK